VFSEKPAIRPSTLIVITTEAAATTEMAAENMPEFVGEGNEPFLWFQPVVHGDPERRHRRRPLGV